MIGELNLDGIFLSSVLVSAVMALAVVFITRRLLVWTGAYRLVWHPALFDTALFVIVWAAVSRLSLPVIHP